MTDLAKSIAKLSNEQLALLKQHIKTDQLLAKTEEIDWEVETTLDFSIQPRGGAVMDFDNSPRVVFVTGATGFLGSFLVQELILQTQAKIYCLVRAVSTAEALIKLNKNWTKFGFTELKSNSRVIPILGDLAKLGFGIEENQLKQLSEEVDVIYHNGTFVNFVCPYKKLKPANVQGTEEILRFACNGKTKPVHYISTISVFDESSNSSKNVFMENELLPENPPAKGGYAQSKWVAESLVRTAGIRGLPVCIYRPSFITGDSRIGVWNTDDFLSRIINACILLGKAPKEKIFLDTVAVDYVSRALVHLSVFSESYGKNFHLTNPILLSSYDLINWVRKFGHSIEIIPFDDWLDELRTEAGESIEDSFFLLLAIFEQENKSSENMISKVRRFDCRHVLDNLTGTDIVCPVPSEELWYKYLSYFTKV